MKDYDRLVTRHKDAIYRQMLRVCGNREDAEDVLVEALVTAFRHSEQLRDEDLFRAWVTKIGRRACNHLKLRESRHPEVSLLGWDQAAPDSESPAAQLQREQLHQCIATALDSLSPLDRAVYEARELQGLSAEETASHTGLSVPAVKARLFRSRKAIRKVLDEELSRD